MAAQNLSADVSCTGSMLVRGHLVLPQGDKLNGTDRDLNLVPYSMHIGPLKQQLPHSVSATLQSEFYERSGYYK